MLLPFLALPAQAQITDVNNYTDLQTNAALAAGDATIRLTADIIDGVTQLTIGRSLTLDLNGHSLTIDLPPATGAISNGIKINNGVTLTIMDSSLPSTGTLTVTNGADAANPPADNSNFGAAINASEGELIIESGTIEVTGGQRSAGIGGGRGRASGTITINGGTVNVTGGSGGASIGGGQTGNGSTITINGGTVRTDGGNCAAAIGGGAGIGCGGGSVVSIVIDTTGTVTATGGNPGGAPIGNGYISFSSGSGAGIHNVTQPTDQTAIVGQTTAFAFMIVKTKGFLRACSRFLGYRRIRHEKELP